MCEKLAAILIAWRDIQVLLEPTGGYENKLIKKLLDYGIQTYMVHPNRLIYFAKSRGLEAKTDKLASKQLALYLHEQPIETMAQVGADFKMIKRLQELSSRRKQLKEILRGENSRLGYDFFDKNTARSLKRMIKSLEQEILKLDALIEEEFKQQAELTTKAKLLNSFKGVGRITAQTLILDVPELGTLSREAVAKMIGLAPLNRDSGKKSGTRHIHGGRGDVRKVLYMAAMVAIRHNAQMRRIFDRLMSRGKVFKVAIVAVMRKMICILNSMIKRNITWQEFTGLAVQKG